MSQLEEELTRDIEKVKKDVADKFELLNSPSFKAGIGIAKKAELIKFSSNTSQSVKETYDMNLGMIQRAVEIKAKVMQQCANEKMV